MPYLSLTKKSWEKAMQVYSQFLINSSSDPDPELLAKVQKEIIRCGKLMDTLVNPTPQNHAKTFAEYVTDRVLMKKRGIYFLKDSGLTLTLEELYAEFTNTDPMIPPELL